MNPKKKIIFLGIALLFFLGSSFYAAKKLRIGWGDSNSRAIIIGNESTTVENPALSGAPIGKVNEGNSGESLGQLDLKNCVANPNFKKYHNELGSIVNDSDLRHHHIPDFIASINEFRRTYGLPVPMNVISKNFDSLDVVYENCRFSCKGAVHQVFISDIIENKMARVLVKDGTLKDIPLHDSGIEATVVDELDKKGVPFRSWKVPATDGPWFVMGSSFYFKLDMENAFLQITKSGNWHVVSAPVGAAKLELVEPAHSIVGCQPDENCYKSLGAGTRHFRAPKLCAAVVKHAADEPAPKK